mgnify:CR=1 FL=1
MQLTGMFLLCGAALAVAIGLNVTFYLIERWQLRRRSVNGTPSNADLLQVAERHPAPQEWYRE